MRYFKIFNSNVTKTQPRKELTEDQFLAEVADMVVSQLSTDLGQELLFADYLLLASTSSGLSNKDYYLYSAENDKTVLDFKRKNY